MQLINLLSFLVVSYWNTFHKCYEACEGSGNYEPAHAGTKNIH